MKFYAPSNFKSGQYILGRFRLIDLLLLIPVVMVSMIMVILIVLFIDVAIWLKITLVVLSVLPGITIFILMLNMEGYHNILEFLKLKFWFSRNAQREYMWEGIQYDKENI